MAALVCNENVASCLMGMLKRAGYPSMLLLVGAAAIPHRWKAVISFYGWLQITTTRLKYIW